MNKKVFIIIAILISAILVFATACGGGNETLTPTATPTTTPTPTATTSPTSTPKPSPEKTLIIGGVPAASSAHVFFDELGRVSNDGIPEIQFNVEDTLGSQAVMNGLIETEFNFGQSLASLEYMAYSGISPFTTPAPDIRRLCSWSTQDLIIAVSESSGIQSIAELSGNILRVGTAGSISEVVTSQVMSTLDIQPSYDKTSLSNLANDLKGNVIAGFAEFVPQNVPDPNIDIIQQETPLKLLSFTDEEIQKVKAIYPYMTTGKIEAGVYQNQNEINTFTIVATLTTLKDSLSEDEAYQIVKTIWEGRDTLAAAYTSFTDYNLPEETIATSLIPLHAGAYSYFVELGLSIPENLIPPEAGQ